MRDLITRVLVLGWTALVVACSSGGATVERPDGSGSGSGASTDPVSGMVGGDSLTVNSATAVVGTTSVLIPGSTVNVALVGFTSASGADCSAIQSSDVQVANSTGLALLIVSSTPVTAATYKVVPNNGKAPTLPAATAVFTETNTKCASVFDGGAPVVKGGTVTIASITSSTIAGKYDLMFSDGALQGSFSTPICSGINLNVIFSSNPDASTPCVQE